MKIYLSAAILLLTLAACGGSDKYSPYGGTDKPTAIKIGKPYNINGKTYYPKYQPTYQEVGVASWYGPGFDGRMTASGERFNTRDITAAHPTLPMPSFVRVTRIDNGKSVIVRVNDRGPFHSNRIIDLSRGAAERLDLIRAGKAVVRVEYLPQETEDYIASLGLEKPADWYAVAQADADTRVPVVEVAELAPRPLQEQAGMPYAAPSEPNLAPQQTPMPTFNVNFVSQAEAATPQAPSGSVSFTAPPKPQTGKYRVLVGAFGVQENADRLTHDLDHLAMPEIRPAASGGRTIYRVVLGPLETHESANSILEQVKSKGYRDARIIVE